VSVRTEWVGYGRRAAEALHREIRAAKDNDPLAPVGIVVPSNHVGVASRRLLASDTLGPLCDRGEGIAAVTFLTVYRLGELLGAARLAGKGRRPVSSPVIGAALRAALQSQPGVFGPVATHPATETALVNVYRELRDLSPGALDALARQSERAADVVRLHREAREALATSWYDEEDLLDAAVETLGSDPPLVAGLGRVVVYLPGRLSRHGAALLVAIGARRQLVVLAGTSGDARADTETTRAVARLGGEPATPPTGGPDLPAVVGPARTQIVTVSDPDEEVRAAVRAIVRAARRGTPLDRMAVLFADAQPYARLAYEQLTAAGVALNGTAVMPLTARVAGRTLLGLLALPDGGFRRDDLFAWLTGARIHHRGRWAPVSAWERLSREAGIVSGRAEWDASLDWLARERDAEAAEVDADPDAPPWRAERCRESAGRARELRDFVLRLVDDMSAAAASTRPWPDWSAWARRHLTDLLGGERSRAEWPVAEQRAAERLERALDRLSCLGEVEGPVSLEVFARTLQLELEADLGRIGRMGEGVFVGPVSMGVGLDLDLVVVLGLAEGVFPPVTRDDSLLPDQERTSTDGELPLRAALVERRHREFLAALAAARQQVLCVPRGDLRGSRERVPSRWALQAAGILSGGGTWDSEELLDPKRSEQPWLHHVASFDAGLRSVDFPASDSEYRLRALLASVPAQRGADGGLSTQDPVLAAGATVIAARRSRWFTRFDGNAAAAPVPSPAEHTVSATRLEAWASCPFAYLLQYVLGLEDVENPEEELTITALDRGSLVHNILEDFIADVLARPVEEQPEPAQPWSGADVDRLEALAEVRCAEYEARGLTGRPVFWRRDRRRIMDDLRRVLELDSEHRRQTATRPVAAELPFGLANAPIGTVGLALDDGREVRFRGKADRVDVAADGAIHVVDYKTGSARTYQKLSEDDPDLGGTRLQLPVYGEAARSFCAQPNAPVHAEYWFTSAKGGFDRIGYPVTAEVLVRVGHSLGTIVRGIERGVFPNHPTATSTTPWVECAYCDPDGLGVAELRRAFERKKEDPAMREFVELIEPPGDEEGWEAGAARA
jgi:RecB family exonuclease